METSHAAENDTLEGVQEILKRIAQTTQRTAERVEEFAQRLDHLEAQIVTMQAEVTASLVALARISAKDATPRRNAWCSVLEFFGIFRKASENTQPVTP